MCYRRCVRISRIDGACLPTWVERRPRRCNSIPRSVNTWTTGGTAKTVIRTVLSYRKILGKFGGRTGPQYYAR